MSPDKLVMKDCPWQVLGEDTAGNIYWCEKCGVVFKSGENAVLDTPYSLDQDTLYCPDRGLVP